MLEPDQAHGRKEGRKEKKSGHHSPEGPSVCAPAHKESVSVSLIVGVGH